MSGSRAASAATSSSVTVPPRWRARFFEQDLQRVRQGRHVAVVQVRDGPVRARAVPHRELVHERSVSHAPALPDQWGAGPGRCPAFSEAARSVSRSMSRTATHRRPVSITSSRWSLASTRLTVSLADPVRPARSSRDRGRSSSVRPPLRGVPVRCASLSRVAEGIAVHAEHDGGEHLNEPSVRVENEALFAGTGDHRRSHLVVHTDVEDGVHHPGHRELRIRSDGHEQRFIGAAVDLAGASLHGGDGRQDLVPQAIRERPVAGDEGVAGLCGDREPGRNRYPEGSHVGEVGALATEQAADPVPIAVDRGSA